MQIRNIAPAALGLMAFVAMASPGCSCGGDTDGPASASTTTSSSSSAGAGGSGGAGGASGAGGGQGGDGQGGGTADNGHAATETVSAGDVSESASYRMVFTVGQPTQNQGTTNSSSYRLQGGLVGANGSSP